MLNKDPTGLVLFVLENCVAVANHAHGLPLETCKGAPRFETDPIQVMS